MTTVAVSPGPEPVTDERRAHWTVARYEALRLVRQPIFVLAVLIFRYATAATRFPDYANADFPAPSARRDRRVR